MFTELLYYPSLAEQGFLFHPSVKMEALQSLDVPHIQLHKCNEENHGLKALTTPLAH